MRLTVQISMRRLLFFSMLLAGELGFAVPIQVEKNIHIRSVKNGRAVLDNNSHGYYVLKSGSTIELPNIYVVRNSIGEIDLASSLRNWRTQDSNVQTYKIESPDKKVIGQDQFFKIRVLSAAPGSNVPSDGGYIALDFLSRTRALRIIDEGPVMDGVPSSAQTGKPNGESSAPLSEGGGSSPKGKAEPDESEKSPSESQLGKLTTGGGGEGSAPSGTVPAPSSSRKDEVLKAVADDPRINNPKFYGSIQPAPEVSLPDGSGKPIPKPSPNPGFEAAQVTAAAVDKVGAAGTQNEVCADGSCKVTAAGSDQEYKLFCEQVKKGKFPESLNSLGNGTEGLKSVKASLKVASLLTRNPSTCKGSCQFEKSGLLGFLQSDQSYLNTYCDRITNCQRNCNTSALVPKTNCTTAIKTATKNCRNQCSPYLDLNGTKRNIHLHSLFDDVTADIKTNNPEYARLMKENGILENMDQRLLCLNRRRENVDLDPYARPCTSTAIGIGQVLKGTFYSTLGLSNKVQKTNCLNIPLKSLAKNCRGFDRHAFRKEIYWKYMDFTPKELYDLRTTDVELQARSSYATFLEKLRFANFKLDSAYKGYFGKSDKSSVNRIENCVRTGK